MTRRAPAPASPREFRQEWTPEPLWARPAESTNILNRERTEHFARRFGHLPIRAVDDDIVREYRRAGRNDGQIPALRAMFNDAARADAGRLVDRNPFAGLRLPQSRGRRDVQPPAQADAARMIALADELTPPSFAAYLDVSIHVGRAPGRDGRAGNGPTSTSPPARRPSTSSASGTSRRGRSRCPSTAASAPSP